MSDVIIRAENLGKSYSIRHSDRPERYTALRDVLSRQAQSAWRRLRRPFYRDPSANFSKNEEFWALKDVSFEIKRGEAVGIIGRNGAGKSTLLKILSRITEPTAGRVTLRGRVASLLEVGTGFHPELTGRENIYLNGAILGMTRAEITRKFDEIVDFAGVEKFLDTPVKRYSSGMYVRLAFAVAAHLEPEILVVDEVLAVGDAEFQQRCLNKMNSIASNGRTVIFVSHQLQAVANLCDTAVELQSGKAIARGPARSVINHYLTNAQRAHVTEKTWSNHEAPGDEIARLFRVQVTSDSACVQGDLASDKPISVILDVECLDTPSTLCVGFDLFSSDGTKIFRTLHTDPGVSTPQLKRGRNVLRCSIPGGLLNYGEYSIAPHIGLHNLKWCVKEDPIIHFKVALTHATLPFWSMTKPEYRGGIVAPLLSWQHD